jgi:hypothetical protein
MALDKTVFQRTPVMIGCIHTYLDTPEDCCRLPVRPCGCSKCCAWIDLLCLLLMLLCCMHTIP